MRAVFTSVTDMSTRRNGEGEVGASPMLPVDRVQAKSLAQRKANRPLHWRRIDQRPCDIGLFSDDAQQLDLVDMTKR